jgi:hypothetical protein
VVYELARACREGRTRGGIKRQCLAHCKSVV